MLAVREAVAGPRHRVKVGHNQDWGVRMDSDLELDTGHGRGPDVQHLLRYIIFRELNMCSGCNQGGSI